MITNERQYRITKAEAEKFRSTLKQDKAAVASRPNLHPRLIQAEQEALQSQLDDLLREIEEYERLKSGLVSTLDLNSFDSLPDGLIRARIACSLSQKALAEKLGLKEQQIQRYESERYSSASFERLREVLDAISAKVHITITLPTRNTSFDSFFHRLQEAGVDKDFLVKRLIPRRTAAQIETDEYEEPLPCLLKDASGPVERIFGWSPVEIFGQAPLVRQAVPIAARFKMPARRNQELVGVYVTYARYLALLVIRASEALPRSRVPSAASDLRREILERYGEVSLESTTHYCWDVGIPVLPLSDHGTFHGATWRVQGRNVIILKQRSPHVSRWLFDLFHEFFHVAQHPDSEELEVIDMEEATGDQRNAEEEIDASRFAGDVVLNGRAEHLAVTCVEHAHHNVRFLKRAVQTVATEEGVSVGLLANYLAYRLSWENVNWWGTAANLQEESEDPWELVRDIFLERFSFDQVSDVDLELLQRALT